MGLELSYEIGQLNIGRRVKVYGHGSKQHGIPAKLTGAHPKGADVLIDNHGGRSEQVEWHNVRDWTSQNQQPLVLPPVKATPIVKTAPVVVAPPLPPKDPFAVFAGLSQEIPAAMQAIAEAEEEVDTATEMLQQAEARHKRAKQGLQDIKNAIDSAKAMIDKVLA